MLAGCSPKTTNVNSDTTTKKEVTEKAKDIPDGNYSDIGEGTFYIDTSSGSSEDGSVPFLFSNDEDVLISIGCGSKGMNGNNLSYIYSNGMLLDKIQLSEQSQSTLSLTEDFLTIGTHKVEVLQFDTDKPDGTVITYKSAAYEVKEK